MGRNQEFHLGRLGPGLYEGHGYRIVRRGNSRQWDIHYPLGDTGEPSSHPDDVVGDLATAKEWAKGHWEDNRK